MHIISPQQWQTQRWQNGGGITHQLCRQDDAQGMLWRLSVAEVASDGPFSRFEHIDRIIMLLDGAGFSLHGEGFAPQVLNTPLTPFAFAGETPIQCSLINGAVRDFNLMTRRGALQAQLQVLDINSRGCSLPVVDQTLLFVASGEVEVEFKQQSITLAAEQTLQLSADNDAADETRDSGKLQLSVKGDARLVYIRLSAISGC